MVESGEFSHSEAIEELQQHTSNEGRPSLSSSTQGDNLYKSYRKNYMTFLNNSSLKSHYKFQKSRSELMTILSNDKKVNNAKINFVLLEEIEKPVLREVDIEQAMELILDE